MPAKVLTEADVVITITTEQEDEGPFSSQYSLTKDETDARRYAAAVEEMCDKHDDWGWCVAVVKARLGPLEGFAYLGNCSYEGVEDFKKGGYYPQMVKEAIAELQVQVNELYPLIHAD
jgi:hypothetical protein